jgi:hypothetical protein
VSTKPFDSGQGAHDHIVQEEIRVWRATLCELRLPHNRGTTFPPGWLLLQSPRARMFYHRRLFQTPAPVRAQNCSMLVENARKITCKWRRSPRARAYRSPALSSRMDTRTLYSICIKLQYIKPLSYHSAMLE